MRNQETKPRFETIDPQVGMGATRLLFTDRHAYTIVEVRTPKCVVVQRDTAKRLDKNGQSTVQDYEYIPDPNAPKLILRLCKRGWQAKGPWPFRIGSREEYYDPNF